MLRQKLYAYKAENMKVIFSFKITVKDEAFSNPQIKRCKTQNYIYIKSKTQIEKLRNLHFFKRLKKTFLNQNHPGKNNFFFKNVIIRTDK